MEERSEQPLDTNHPPGPPQFPVWLGWCIWGGFWAVFTYGLLSPDPPRAVDILHIDWLKVIASKMAHFSGFALLTFLAGRLPGPRRLAFPLWVFLAFFGAITEYLQTFVEGRHGNPMDTAINWTGIALGLFLIFRRKVYPNRSHLPPRANDSEVDSKSTTSGLSP